MSFYVSPKSALSHCVPYEMCYTNKLDLTSLVLDHHTASRCNKGFRLKFATWRQKDFWKLFLKEDVIKKTCFLSHVHPWNKCEWVPWCGEHHSTGWRQMDMNYSTPFAWLAGKPAWCSPPKLSHWNPRLQTISRPATTVCSSNGDQKKVDLYQSVSPPACLCHKRLIVD